MSKPITLNLIVDKSCNRVRYVESDGQFVDLLLSFLTLPLGSILHLTKQSIGSMNTLLQSVQSLSSVCFISEACRSMLLWPSNSSSNIFSSLPIKYDSISNLFRFYYTSSSCSNHHLTFYANAYCPCGFLMNQKLEFLSNAPSTNANSSARRNTAVKFTVDDDLLVSQFSVEFATEKLSKLDIKQLSSLESVSVDITAEHIVELLKRLLVSDTPLTDVFLGVHEEKDKLQVIQQPLLPKCDEAKAPTAYTNTRKISMKLYVNEDEDTTLFAEADNDFADLMFGFLTYPMCAVISKLGGRSGIRCMDNLYNSVVALNAANCFLGPELIGMLLNPKLPPYFKVKNQLINLGEQTQTQKYFTCKNTQCHYSSKVGNKYCTWQHYNDGNCRQFNLTDPKRALNDDASTGGYMRISSYMVTDDLIIRQPSSSMVITGIVKKNAVKGIDAGKGIHARKIEIGEHEALALLRYSITSENVLTDALLAGERGKPRVRSY